MTTHNTKTDAEHEEGRSDGATWAQEYAAPDELHHIAEEFEPGRGGDFQDHSVVTFMGVKDGMNYVSVRHEEASPYWEGFVDGARDVLAANPLR